MKKIKILAAVIAAAAMSMSALGISSNAEWFDDVDISNMTDWELREFIDKVGEELYPSPKQPSVAYYQTQAQEEIMYPFTVPKIIERDGQRYDLFIYNNLPKRNMQISKIYNETAERGIAFELQDDAKISDLNLKYPFLNAEDIDCERCGNKIKAIYGNDQPRFLGLYYNTAYYMNHRIRSNKKRERCEVMFDQVYLYYARSSMSDEELISYAKELEKNKAVKYVKAFYTREVQDKQTMYDTTFDDCRIYLTGKNGETLDAEELNKNTELLSRLEEIGVEGKFYPLETDPEKMTKFEERASIEQNNIKCDVYVKLTDDRSRYFDVISQLEACEGLENAEYVSTAVDQNYSLHPDSSHGDVCYYYEGGAGPNAATVKNLKKMYESFKKDGNVDVLFVPDYPFDPEEFAYQVIREEIKMGMIDTSEINIKNTDMKWYSSDLGDANDDGKTNVRDCACIANALSKGKAASLPDKADYNQDTQKNVRDAANLSDDLANS